MHDSDHAQQRDQFVARTLRPACGTFETFTVYPWHRLGYFADLADAVA